MQELSKADAKYAKSDLCGIIMTESTAKQLSGVELCGECGCFYPVDDKILEYDNVLRDFLGRLTFTR